MHKLVILWRQNQFKSIYLVSNIEMSEGYEMHNKYWKRTNHCCRFQKACTAYGVPDVDLFQTVDLWDRKNIAQVTMTIFAIGRTVSSIDFRNNHILITVSVMGILVWFFTTCIMVVPLMFYTSNDALNNWSCSVHIIYSVSYSISYFSLFCKFHVQLKYFNQGDVS